MLNYQRVDTCKGFDGFGVEGCGNNNSVVNSSFYLLPGPIPNLLLQFEGVARRPTHPQTISPHKPCISIVHLFMSSGVPTGWTATLCIVISLSLHKVMSEKNLHATSKTVLSSFRSSAGGVSLLNCIWYICPIWWGGALAPCQLLDDSVHFDVPNVAPMMTIDS